MFKLQEIKQLDISTIRAISKLLNQADQHNDFRLDCNGVAGLTDEELKALFSNIRPEWLQDQRGLDNFIDLDSLENEPDLFTQIEDYLDNPPPPIKSAEEELQKTKEELKRAQSEINTLQQQLQEAKEDNKRAPKQNKLLTFALPLIGILGGIILGIPLTTYLTYLSQPRVSAKTITIGSLAPSYYYDMLEIFLEERLKPDNFWDYLKGEKIEVQIENIKSRKYSEAIGKIKSQEWDIAFGYSPVVSLEAEEAGYEYIANMYPESPTYQSIIFTKKGSPITSQQDFVNANPPYTIALGDYFSASKFIMPVYVLYGSQLSVSLKNKAEDIVSLVKEGEMDLGVFATDPKYFDPNDPKLAFPGMDKETKNIPTSAVFLSPQLNPQDRETLKQLLLNAPEKVKDFDHANYGEGEKPNYQEFKDIIDRVSRITACRDFSVNPVKFYCDENQEILVLQGEIVDLGFVKNKAILKVKRENTGEICPISIEEAILTEVVNYNKISDLQGFIFDGYVAIPKGKKCENIERYTSLSTQSHPNL